MTGSSRLRVVDFLPREAIIASMHARTREEAIAELAEQASRVQKGVSHAAILKVLQERERLGSTGIGEGVAIPHGTVPALPQLLAVFGRSASGIDYDAVDGRPVQLFFVLLTPDNHSGLQALARVARLMRRPEVVEALKSGGDVETLYRVISEEEQRL